MVGFWEQLTLPIELEAPALPGPRTRDDRLAAGLGARRLLAVILRQALADQSLALNGGLPDSRQWPWDGQWTLQEELDAFWQSDWFENVCSWLDMDSDGVIDFVEELRNGKRVIEIDKRRTVRTGSPGP